MLQLELLDKEEDQAYKDQTGYEIPEDLKHKKARLKQIKEAKVALEQREEALKPGKDIDDKKQISFADKEARIMGKKGSFDYQYNAQISVDEDTQIIVGQHLSQNANDKQEIEPALVAINLKTAVKNFLIMPMTVNIRNSDGFTPQSHSPNR